MKGICFILLWPVFVLAQPLQSKHLFIGASVPDLELNNIINYKSPSARLSDFKGKLLILDFWEAYCGACIRALPKLDSLQRAFSDQIQVLTVTQRGTGKALVSELQRFKLTRGVKLPIVIADDVLHKLFPHEIISHVVWIDGKGIVKAITGTEYVTAENIQAVLNEAPINWPVKKDIPDFDIAAPLLRAAGEGTPATHFYSTLTTWWEGAPQLSAHSIDSAGGRQVVNYMNFSLLQLLRVSVDNAGGLLNSKQLVLEVKDTSRLFFIRDKKFYAEWERANAYCYSLTLPLHLSPEEVKTAVREDLSRWLQLAKGVSMKKEKRVVPCLALVRTTDQDCLFTAGGGPENTLAERGPVKYLRNSSFSNLAAHLNSAVPGIRWVVDETGIDKRRKVDIKLAITDWSNIPELRRALQPYGLDLVPVQRERLLYVVTENSRVD